MKTAALCMLFLLLPLKVSLADLVVFGTSGDQFTMEFVPIGNAGNTADTTGSPNPAGAVAYAFSMGKYEVSEDMINKANTLGNLGITKDTRGTDKPATNVSWNEAARFVNWLNTSAGFQPAYKFTTQPSDMSYSANENISLWTMGDPGFNAANPFRNSLAVYVLPSIDEWYKAAYHDATAGTTGTYFNYPTGSDMAPTTVASGTGAGTAVYGQASATGPADIMSAGGLSSYGTAGQGGNVFEWEETESDLLNNLPSSARDVRGGMWFNGSPDLQSSLRSNAGPATSFNVVGFRVASVAVPEPSPVLYGALLTAYGLLVKWMRS